MSTKNQFLNARLFRTERPACTLSLLRSPSFLISLCFDFFNGALTLKHRLAGDRIRVTIFNDNFIWCEI